MPPRLSGPESQTHFKQNVRSRTAALGGAATADKHSVRRPSAKSPAFFCLHCRAADAPSLAPQPFYQVCKREGGDGAFAAALLESGLFLDAAGPAVSEERARSALAALQRHARLGTIFAPVTVQQLQSLRR